MGRSASAEELRSTLSYLIGAHLDRISESNTAPGQDTAELAEHLMLLDTLAYPILVEDEQFQARIDEVKGAQCPPDKPIQIWEQERRYRMMREIVRALYENNVLRARQLEWDSFGEA